VHQTDLYFSSQACWSKIYRSPSSSAMMKPRLNCPITFMRGKSCAVNAVVDIGSGITKI
jgi:hypothetical protein